MAEGMTLSRISCVRGIGIAFLLALAQQVRRCVLLHTNKPGHGQDYSSSASSRDTYGGKESYPRYGRLSRSKRSKGCGSGAYGHIPPDASVGPRPGCDALCWSVEQWYVSSLDVLKSSPYDAYPQQLKKQIEEWNQARIDLRLHEHNGGHCLIFFGRMVDYCQAVVLSHVSEKFITAMDYAVVGGESALLKPTCKRFLHMAKMFEDDAALCLEGKGPRDL